MKKIFFVFYFLFFICSVQAEPSDSVFHCKVSNSEYNVYLDIDFYHKNIVIQGAEFLGEMAGFLGDSQDYRKWYITDAEVKDSSHATLYLTNDTGSEDLEATLTYNPDTKEYTLHQGSGSSLKIARNKKWKKLPGTMIFR